jgi:hypothetical protein
MRRVPLRLLPAGCQRPRRRAAEQRDERTSLQSIELHPLALRLAWLAPYRIGEAQSGLLRCGISTRLMSGWGSDAVIRRCPRNVRFSNRPFGVKHFQTIHLCGFDVVSRARASLRNRHEGPSIMGFEDEVEQSLERPCR